MAKINSKNKGNTAERELCKILEGRFEGHKFMRVPNSGAMFGASNRHLAEGVEDVITNTFVGDIITPTNFKYSIESKFYKDISFWDLFNESSNLHQWFRQAEDDAKFSDRKPMIVAKFNHRGRICFVKEKRKGYVFEHMKWYCYWLDDFLKLKDDMFFEEKE